DKQHGFILGTYTDQTTHQSANAYLLIDFDTYQSSGLWVVKQAQGASPTIAQVTGKPDDTFEPTYLVMNSSGQITPTPSGTKLVFGKDPFTVTQTPGPDGKYAIVMTATDAAGKTTTDQTTVAVKNSGLDTTLQGFKDLGFGLSFLYPFD